MTWLQYSIMGVSWDSMVQTNVSDSIAVWLRVAMFASCYVVGIAIVLSQIQIMRHPDCVYVDYDPKTDTRTGDFR